jgi:hypothetical protein
VLGHEDLLGTLLRFLPLFQDCGALPAWASAPADGGIVFVTDADYNDFSTEHAHIHLVKWYAQAAAAASAAGAPHPHLVALTTSGSAAPRHLPACGLPPFIANCLATRTRFPAEWLTDFLDDMCRPPAAAAAATGTGEGSGGQCGGYLSGVYCGELHDPRRRNFTYAKRRIAEQRSPFPFGIDEFFLTAALKLRQLAGPLVAEWLFLVLPNIDIVLLRCLTLVEAALHDARADGQVAAGGGGLDKYLHRILCGGAQAAGDADAAALLASAAPPVSAADWARRVAAWKEDWPRRSCLPTALFSPFPGRFLPALPSVAYPALRGLRAAVGATLEALAAGRLPHTPEDMEVLRQNLEALAEACGRDGPLVAATYLVGDGRVRRLEPSGTPHAASLLHELRSARGCAVPFPRLEHVGCKAGWEERKGMDPVVRQALQRAAEADAAEAEAAAAAGRSAAAASAAGVAAVPPVSTPSSDNTGPGASAAAAVWTDHTSASTGKRYYYNASTKESLWHDDALPEGWAWTRAAAGGRTYVHMASGERTATAPSSTAAVDSLVVSDGARLAGQKRPRGPEEAE